MHASSRRPRKPQAPYRPYSTHKHVNIHFRKTRYVLHIYPCRLFPKCRLTFKPMEHELIINGIGACCDAALCGTPTIHKNSFSDNGSSEQLIIICSCVRTTVESIATPDYHKRVHSVIRRSPKLHTVILTVLDTQAREHTFSKNTICVTKISSSPFSKMYTYV